MENIGICACGCGGITPVYNQTNKRRGIIRGEHAKFIRGHNQQKLPTPYETGEIIKYCECGCGQALAPAKRAEAGQVKKGEVRRFISGHNTTRGDTEMRDGERWKKCQKCSIWKSVEIDFYPKNNTPWGSSPCKKCTEERHASEEYKTSRKEYDLIRRWERHGQSLDWFKNLYLLQNQSCAICKRQFEMNDLHVDHDHSCCQGEKSCGKCIRGLLCSGDNLGIGHMNEDVTRLKAAIAYILEKRANCS